MTGVWYGTAEDAARHQAAMDVVPFGRYEAMAEFGSPCAD